MHYLKYGIGIDISMEKFDACISTIDMQQQISVKATKRFSNSLKGFSAFYSWVDSHRNKSGLPVVFLMEATGIYYEKLAWFLYGKQEHVSIILPNKASKYKESIGLRSKTDSIDSKGLSRMACEQHLKPWEPLSADIYLLRQLTRQIDNISCQITRVNNQLHALKHAMFQDKMLVKLLERQIKLLESQKVKLKARVLQIIEDNQQLKEKCEKIAQIKGLGVYQIAVVIAETNGFELFSRQSQLVSYGGYDVIEDQSGKHSGKTRISKKGSRYLRKALHMPALNVVRLKQKPFCDLYKRVYDKSKIKMKAYTAVQKKLLITIYTLWRKNECYNPDYKWTPNTSEKAETEPSFALAPEEAKISPGTARAKQDRHPLKDQRMPSFAYGQS